MLVDSHCHLNFPEFANQIDDVVARAVANDVAYMQTICTKLVEFPRILEIAKQHKNVWCSVGVHPNNMEEEPPFDSETLISLAKDDKVIGLGETGLDYYYERSDRIKQKQGFLAHIAASQETRLPVIVHTRSADDDTIEILQEQYAKKKFPALIHCFSTGAKLAYAAIELGMYISISGIVTFKKANELQDIVKDLPLDKILVETDAPYLAPMPYRGKTNEPAYTKNTAQFIADLKGISYEEVAETTTRNFFDLFTKAKR